MVGELVKYVNIYNLKITITRVLNELVIFTVI